MNRTPISPEADRVEILAAGELRVTADYLPLLQSNGLDRFDKIMAYKGGDMMRSVPGRSTVKIELRKPDGGKQVAFLKRYEPEYLSFWEKLLRLVRWPGEDDEALHEWKMIQVLNAHGFDTATPIAAGQQRRTGIVTRSFLLTKEIARGIPADEYLASRSPAERRSFAVRLGELTRRFHRSGFIHKDYYLAHVFVVLRGDDFELRLIDLQRVIGPGRFRGRWRKKDLGSLAYSAQVIGVPGSDLMRFFKEYFLVERLDDGSKQFIRGVMARVAALHRRGPKHDVIWDRPGVHPRSTLEREHG